MSDYMDVLSSQKNQPPSQELASVGSVDGFYSAGGGGRQQKQQQRQRSSPSHQGDGESQESQDDATPVQEQVSSSSEESEEETQTGFALNPVAFSHPFLLFFCFFFIFPFLGASKLSSAYCIFSFMKRKQENWFSSMFFLIYDIYKLKLKRCFKFRQ